MKAKKPKPRPASIRPSHLQQALKELIDQREIIQQYGTRTVYEFATDKVDRQNYNPGEKQLSILDLLQAG